MFRDRYLRSFPLHELSDETGMAPIPLHRRQRAPALCTEYPRFCKIGDSK